MKKRAAEAPTDVGYFTLTGDVNSDMVRRVFDAISLFSSDQLRTAHILLQSNGGYVSDGICIYNTLRNGPTEIVMYNAGAVASIAVIVFLAADKRIASDTARFMLHKSHATLPTGARPDAIQIIVDGLLADDRRTEAILRRHVGLPATAWDVHAATDLHLTSEDALKVGLITRIDQFMPPFGAMVRTI